MPFVETALYSTQNGEDNIVHFGAVRYRVDGSGNLETTMYGYNKVESSALLPLTMSNAAGRDLTRLANFKAQKVLLRIETNEIDEVMRFNRIIIYAKDLYSTYPGQ